MIGGEKKIEGKFLKGQDQREIKIPFLDDFTHEISLSSNDLECTRVNTVNHYWSHRDSLTYHYGLVEDVPCRNYIITNLK